MLLRAAYVPPGREAGGCNSPLVSTMAHLLVSGLREKVQNWLPMTVKGTLSDKGATSLQRAFTNSTNSSENMEVAGKYGDIHMKSCLATV